MKLSLTLIDEVFAICSLPKDSQIPEWVLSSNFYSVTRTFDELSVVCPQANIPEGTRYNKGWKCFKVQGPLGFSIVGILASLAMPLANSGISVFVFSSYDTDHIMVKEYDLEKAISVLTEAGHTVNRLS